MALSVSKTREKIQFNKKIINSKAQLQENGERLKIDNFSISQ